jgi:hypothetical protein
MNLKKWDFSSNLPMPLFFCWSDPILSILNIYSYLPSLVTDADC